MTTTPGNTDERPTGGTDQNGGNGTGNRNGNSDQGRNSQQRNNRNNTGGRGNQNNDRRNQNNNNNNGTNFMKSFKGEVPDVDAVLGTSIEQREYSDRYNKFTKKILSYVSRDDAYKHPEDLRRLLEDGEDPIVLLQKRKPKAPTAKEQEDLTTLTMFQNKIKKFVEREEILDTNLFRLWNLIWGQLTPNLKQLIKREPDYKDARDDNKVVWLLTALRKSSANIDHTQNCYKSAITILKLLASVRQKKGESIDDMKRRFDGIYDTLPLVGLGDIFRQQDFADMASDGDLDAGEEGLKAMLLLLGGDHQKYKPLYKDLDNRMVLGDDQYPVTTAAAYDILCRFDTSGDGGKNRNPNQHPNGQPQGGGGTQNGNQNGNQNGTGRPPLASFSQVKEDYEINPAWVLLDTCSTVTSFHNPELLHDITDCDDGEDIVVIANGNGELRYKQFGTETLLGIPAFFEPTAIANILSMADVTDRFRVTMDTEKHGTVIFVHLSDGDPLRFEQCGSGLYYYDTSTNGKSNISKDKVVQYSLLSTVRDNKRQFSAEEMRAADKARRLQHVLDWPISADMKMYMNNRWITNCPLTSLDYSRADSVYGKAVPIIKSREVRGKPARHLVPARIPLPADLAAHHRTTAVHLDFIYVNGLPFFHTKSKPHDFLTIKRLPSRALTGVRAALTTVHQMYTSRGFIVSGFHGDNEFRPLEPHFAPVPFHITAANEHDGVIERSARTLKERARACTHSTPYRRVPNIMIQHLMERVIHFLIAFPTSTGISQERSPANLILGRPNLDYNNLTLAYGAYCQVYIGTTNTQRQRTVGAIALRPSNERGGHYFMSLMSGEVVHGYQWTELPIDDVVLARVDELAAADNAPYMNDGPIFEWRPGIPLPGDAPVAPPAGPPVDDPPAADAVGNDDNGHDDDDDDDDPTDFNYVPVPDDVLPADDDISLPGPDDAEVDALLADAARDFNLIEPPEPAAPVAPAIQGADPEPAPTVDPTPLPPPDSSSASDSDDDDTSHNSDDSSDDSSDPPYDGPTPSPAALARPTVTNTRPKRSNAGTGVERLKPSLRGKTYGTQLLNIQKRLETDKKYLRQLRTISVNAVFAQVVKEELTAEQQRTNTVPGGSGSKQMSAKRGIKLFGQAAIDALYKEYKQFFDLDVFEGIDPNTLTEEQKQRALDTINTIKQKRCGKVKGRTVGDGRKQRGYVSKEESSSPTPSLLALLTTMVIDAVEGRDVAIYDIPGAFLQSRFPDSKFVVAKFVGEYVDIMCSVNPSLRQYVTYENGVKVLYLRVLAGLYGCMESALLWYKLYTSVLKDMGFELNPYDQCVANRMVNGSQQTICFYVDDNKISHVDPEVNTEVIKRIEERFGKLDIWRGTKHDLLGMKVDFIGDGKVTIDLRDHIKEGIEAFGDDVSRKVSSPATKHLHSVNPNSAKLSAKQADTFHSVVSKMLWIAHRARPDIDPAISFLCTRVKSPTREDWYKLKRVMQWVNQTIDDIRVIGANDLSELFTWVDAAYAVHENMRSHTGGAMSFGWGLLHYLSAKQKLNTKSSTEAEIVGVSDYLPYTIWLRMFLECQGYYLTKNEVLQDNESAARMEKNGRMSCTGNSRHVDIRYFFTKDRVDKGEFTIQYCPTTQMLADYYTKPLQGSLFRAFRKVIMGWKPISYLQEYLSESKERVGDINCAKTDLKNQPYSYADITKKDLPQEDADDVVIGGTIEPTTNNDENNNVN